MLHIVSRKLAVVLLVFMELSMCACGTEEVSSNNEINTENIMSEIKE